MAAMEQNEPNVLRQIYAGTFDHLFNTPLRDVRLATTSAAVARFSKFVAIDWSGANSDRLKGIAVAECDTGCDTPSVLSPPEGRWSRATILELLSRYAEERLPALIGFDFSPALPFVDQGAYFPGWDQSPADMRSLWSLVDEICESDVHLSVSTFVSHEHAREHFRAPKMLGAAFQPGRGRLRCCEKQQLLQKLSPSSCFNLIGAAQVGKSSLTGMRVLQRLNGRIPLWPLDPAPDVGPYLVEIYTTIAAREAGRPAGRAKVRTQAELDDALHNLGVSSPAPCVTLDDHTTDAVITSAWLRKVATRMELWSPTEMKPEVAGTEGWTFGVT